MTIPLIYAAIVIYSDYTFTIDRQYINKSFYVTALDVFCYAASIIYGNALVLVKYGFSNDGQLNTC